MYIHNDTKTDICVVLCHTTTPVTGLILNWLDAVVRLLNLQLQRQRFAALHFDFMFFFENFFVRESHFDDTNTYIAFTLPNYDI
jgi:hypothetical protein